MGNLILDSLEIRNFRGFEHLQIERLGRVNLIVGKNNVGKTSLLEALQIYANRGIWPLIWEILAARDEVPWPLNDMKEMIQGLKYLFYERQDIRLAVNTIQIGPATFPSKSTLVLDVVWFEKKDNKLSSSPSQYSEEQFELGNMVPCLSLNIGKGPLYVYLNPSPILTGIGFEKIPYVFVPIDGLSIDFLEELWGKIALLLDKDVLDAMRIIAPDLEGLSFVKVPYYAEKERLAVVKVVGIEDRIPLRSLGHGVLRALGIVLALVNARDGIVLIDEFENGLHYSILSNLWNVVVKLADRLNVQVFATTHSWDCVEAFQMATQENEQVEGMLIRLNKKESGIDATLFDKRRMTIATKEQIEVR